MISAEDYLGLIAVEACAVVPLDLSLEHDRSAFRDLLHSLAGTPLSPDLRLQFRGMDCSLSSTSLLHRFSHHQDLIQGSDLSSAIQSTRVEARALLPFAHKALITEDETLEAFRIVARGYADLVRPFIDEGVHPENSETEFIDASRASSLPNFESHLEQLLRRLEADNRSDLRGEEGEEIRDLMEGLHQLATTGEEPDSDTPPLERLHALADRGKTVVAFHLLREFFEISMELEKRNKSWLDLVQEPAAAAALTDSAPGNSSDRYKWTDWRVLDVLRDWFSDQRGDHSHDLLLKRVADQLGRPEDPPLSCLVIGAGEGRLPQDLDRLAGGRIRMVATDHDPGNVMYAYAHYVLGGNRDIDCNIAANVANLSMFGDASFDLIVSHGVLRYFVSHCGRKGASELARVIRPGGLVLFQDALRPPWSSLTRTFRDYLQAAGLTARIDKEQHRVKNLSITYKLIMHYEAQQQGPPHKLLREVVDRLVDQGMGADYLQVIASLTGTRQEWVRLVSARRPATDEDMQS